MVFYGTPFNAHCVYILASSSCLYKIHITNEVRGKNVNFQLFVVVVKMTESEEWTYLTTVNKYRFCISVIGYINMQIIVIGYKKINIGRSLLTTPSVSTTCHAKLQTPPHPIMHRAADYGSWFSPVLFTVGSV